jgi:hypothetical protein
MFDPKFFDSNYSTPDMLMLSLGLHPDQQEARDRLSAAMGGDSRGFIGNDENPLDPATGRVRRVNTSDDEDDTLRRIGLKHDTNTTTAPDWLQGKKTEAALGDSSGGASGSSSVGSTIARPRPARTISASPINIDEIAADQNAHQQELERMRKTGSGISQIKNPVGRTIARIGDIAGTALFPGITAQIPGTELHHQQLMSKEAGAVAQDEGARQKEAQIEQEEAKADQERAKARDQSKPISDAAGNILGWNVNGEILGPKSDKLTKDQKDIMDAAEGKPVKDASPETQTFMNLITPKDQGGEGLTHAQALERISQLKNTQKPDTATQHKEAFEAALTKAIGAAGGKVPKGVYTDLQKAADFIASSPALTQQEKTAAQAYLGANATPMSSGSAASIRIEGMNTAREYPVIDTQTGNLVMANAETINASPGRYQPAGEGGKNMQRQALINDIRTAAESVKKNIGQFDAGVWDKLKIGSSLADPNTTSESLLQSIPRGSLNDQQIQLVNDLFTLRENAMAMRSVLGAGQGSEDVRRAILNTLPGPSTPSGKFGTAQIDNLLKTLERVEKGLPTNTPQRGGTEGNKPKPKQPTDAEKKHAKYGFVED